MTKEVVRKNEDISCLGVVESEVLESVPTKIYSGRTCVDYNKLINKTILFYDKKLDKYYKIKVLNYYKKNKHPRLVVKYKDLEEYDIDGNNFILYGLISNVIRENPNQYYKENDYWIMTVPLKGRVNKQYFDKEVVKVKFTADEELLKEIQNSVWYVGKHQIKFYVQTGNYNKTGKTAKLHQIVCKREKKHSFIDHINGDTFDNRIENLKESSAKQNTRNKKGAGFPRLNNKKWLYEIRVDGYLIHTPSKSYEEADIDALIVQKHFNYKHRIDEWHRIDNIDEQYKQDLINLMDNKLKKAKERAYNFTKNEYKVEMLENEEFIRVFDGFGSSTIINKEDKYIIDKGRIWFDNGYWRITIRKINYKLHRYILGINETGKLEIQVDHLNQNPSNNRRNNLIITTPLGNYSNKRNIYINKTKNGTFQVRYSCYWEYISEHKDIYSVKNATVDTETEAILEVKRRKWLANYIRPQFKTYQDYLIFKEEYDSQNTSLSIDDYWITTRFPNINDIEIPKFTEKDMDK